MDTFLYHYTDFIGLDGILTKEGIRLCDIQSMNDKKEMEYFLLRLEDSIKLRFEKNGYEDKIKEVQDIFVNQKNKREQCTAFAACFSELRDDAAQWERYGKNGQGVSIGFNESKLREITNKRARLQPVYYEADVSNHEFVNLFEEIFSYGLPRKGFETIDGLFDNIYECTMAFKHPSFKAEKEVRLSRVTEKKGTLRGLGERKFLITSTNIKKYYTIDLKKCCRKENIKMDELVTEIIIGPKSMQSIESLKVYLNRNGLDMLENKVKKSDCPLR